VASQVLFPVEGSATVHTAVLPLPVVNGGYVSIEGTSEGEGASTGSAGII
jgi:hypothetical protein